QLSQTLAPTGTITLTFNAGSWKIVDTAPGTANVDATAGQTTLQVTFPDTETIDVSSLDGNEFSLLTSNAVVLPKAGLHPTLVSGRTYLYQLDTTGLAAETGDVLVFGARSWLMTADAPTQLAVPVDPHVPFVDVTIPENPNHIALDE